MIPGSAERRLEVRCVDNIDRRAEEMCVLSTWSGDMKKTQAKENRLECPSLKGEKKEVIAKDREYICTTHTEDV